MNRFLKSFLYAFKGIWFAFSEQPNLKIHVGVALVVVFGYEFCEVERVVLRADGEGSSQRKIGTTRCMQLVLPRPSGRGLHFADYAEEVGEAFTLRTRSYGRSGVSGGGIQCVETGDHSFVGGVELGDIVH